MERTNLVIEKKPQRIASERPRDYNRLWEERSKQAISLLRQLPSFLAAIQGFGEGNQYRVILSAEARQRLKTGTVEWVRRGNDVVAIVQNSKTKRFVEHAQLEQVPSTLIGSLQQLVNQRTLMAIIMALC